MLQKPGCAKPIAICAWRSYYSPMFWGVAISTFLAALFIPSDAWAWGLATHVEVARTLLTDYRDVLQAFASSILSFPDAFMYGSISPDHFLMKNLQRYRDHSHNWDRGFAMLKKADTEQLESFSLGYLAHLAADAVAHNVFVPSQIATSKGMAARRHTLWELRFDSYQPTEASMKVLELERMESKRELDRYLAGFHSPSVFDLPTNLQLTTGAHRVLHSNVTRIWVEKWEKRSVSPVREEDVLFYNRLSLLYVLDVIRHGRNSLVVGLDPRGGEQIADARVAVRQESKGSETGAGGYDSRFIGSGARPVVPSRKFLHSDGLTAYLANNSNMQAPLGFLSTSAVKRVTLPDGKPASRYKRERRTPK